MKNIGQKSGNGPIGDQFVASGGPSGGACVGSGKDGGWTGLRAWESIDYWKMEILARNWPNFLENSLNQSKLVEIGENMSNSNCNRTKPVEIGLKSTKTRRNWS